MSIPVTVLGSTIIWPTQGDTNYSAGTTAFVQLVSSALDPIAGLYNTTTGHVGNLALNDSDNLTLNGVAIGGVDSFNTRTGEVLLTSLDVTDALTYTPYNATNPAGYTTNLGTVTSVAISGANGIGIASSPITTSGTIALSLGAITPTSVEPSGNIVMASSTLLQANFTSSSFGGRTLVQTSTVDGTTRLSVVPNGISVDAGLELYNAFPTTNANFLLIHSDATAHHITSSINGGATLIPINLVMGGSGAIQVTPLASQVFGPQATALSTSATDRFLYLQTCAGTPIGTPTSITGHSPLVIDSTNNRFYFYSGGAWRNATTGGTVTSVTGTGTVSGLTLSGTVTSSGNLTLGGTLSLTSSDVTTALTYTPYNATNPAGYTTNVGTVTSVSVTTANGVSGSVATPTVTPAITLTLGAITPSSVAASGTVTGSNLSGTSSGANTGDQTIALTGDVTGTGVGSFVTTLANTAVTPASYTNANITIDSKGRITAAANGTNGTVTSVAISGANGIGVASSPITTSGTIALSLGAITPTSVAPSGNLVMSTGTFIQGDFSNTTIPSRTAIQSSTVDGATSVEILPNGTSNNAAIFIENSSGAANDFNLQMGVTSTFASIVASIRGSGTLLPLQILEGALGCILLSTAGNIILGPQASALSTSATDRFLHLQSCAGTPSGTPTAISGHTPLVVDSTNNMLYMYTNSAWRSMGAPAYEAAVATAAQTVFNTTLRTIANAVSHSFLQIFVNGVKQMEGAGKAYTVTGANQITFNAGVTLNSDVEFYSFA